MKTFKEFLHNSGLVLMGLVGVIMVILLIGWVILKAIGHFFMWFIDMKIQEKYHKDEKEQEVSK